MDIISFISPLFPVDTLGFLADVVRSDLLSVKCNFDRLSNHFGFCPCVCVCVCPPISCRTITSAILYRFSPNFAYRSEMWLFRTLLFLGQTGSSLPILEMCKVRFWQFCDCGGHIFPRIVTKKPKWDITNQHWLCTRWSTKPEIEFGF